MQHPPLWQDIVHRIYMAEEVDHVPLVIENEHEIHPTITGIQFYKKIISESDVYFEQCYSDREKQRHAAILKYCKGKIREFINPRTAKRAILKHLFDRGYIINSGTAINDILMTYKELWNKGSDLRFFINGLKTEGLINFTHIKWSQSNELTAEEELNNTQVHISLTHKGEEFINQNNMTNNTFNNFGGTFNHAPNGSITINNDNAKEAIDNVIRFIESKDIADKEFMLMIIEQMKNGEEISGSDRESFLMKAASISEVGGFLITIGQLFAQ